jgi:exodeoxyribonuclease VII small subunit
MTSSTIESVNLSFEEALKELEEIVRKLESGQVSLEEAITCYERGVHLKKQCESLLTNARLKIEEITKDENNSLSLTPSDLT